MEINRDNKTPLYEQLRLVLQDKILLGEWGPGILLPTEQQLCAQYKISRITVRNALERLERSRLIERIQGRGSVVRKRDIKQSQSEVRGYTQSMLLQGIKPRTVLLEKNLVIGSSSLVECFHLDPEETHYFWQFRSLRFLNDNPVVIMNHYVRKDIGDQLLNYDLSNVSFFSIYEKILKQPMYRSEGLITAVQASPENARLLSVEIGSALIWYRGITYLEENITIEVNFSLFVGDKFQFETQMFKPRNINIEKEQVMEIVENH